MRRLQRVGRIVTAAAAGAIVGALSLLGRSVATPVAARGDCFSALRLVRHAIASFESQHGYLPGVDAAAGPAGLRERHPSVDLLVDQLTGPRDGSGMPNPHGPFPGLVDTIPINPFTRSRALVIVPDGVDPVAFAAASRAGWAYLARPGRDARGPLPAGVVLPCGRSDADPSGPPVQDLAFEIEDFQRWR